jgi:hypothetical protein
MFLFQANARNKTIAVNFCARAPGLMGLVYFSRQRMVLYNPVD